MANTMHTPVTVLGLGVMGQAIAATLRRAGVATTVWNRTPGKDIESTAAGAVVAATVAEAVRGDGVIVTVLFDHASVHETLDPVAEQLRGRHLVNLTTTAPEQARELAGWAAGHGIDYLDGGIMAVPSMIGEPGASILYSGSPDSFERHRSTLELLATADYLGADAGQASLHDFALLTPMYTMFAGFFHGAAMMRSGGVSAAAYAERAVPLLTAMAQGLPGFAHAIDSGDYRAQVQHLDFQKAALDAIVAASRDAGVGLDVVGPIKELIDRQVAAGHGRSAFERTVEELAGN